MSRTRRRGAARPWDPVKLSVHWWEGEHPVAGHGLETSSGRRYLIQRVLYGRAIGETKGPLRALECVVLPKDDNQVPGQLFPWRWSPRHRRAA